MCGAGFDQNSFRHLLVYDGGNCNAAPNNCFSLKIWCLPIPYHGVSLHYVNSSYCHTRCYWLTAKGTYEARSQPRSWNSEGSLNFQWFTTYYIVGKFQKGNATAAGIIFPAEMRKRKSPMRRHGWARFWKVELILFSLIFSSEYLDKHRDRVHFHFHNPHHR